MKKAKLDSRISLPILENEKCGGRKTMVLTESRETEAESSSNDEPLIFTNTHSDGIQNTNTYNLSTTISKQTDSNNKGIAESNILGLDYDSASDEEPD